MSGVRRGTGSGSGDLSGVDDADDLADDGTIVTAASAGGAGLTPRDLTPRAVRPARPRRWLPIVLVAVVAVAIVALLVNAVGNASLFFKGADAAVQGRAELGAKRFRMQGAVVQDTVVETELDGRPAVAFTVVFNHVRLPTCCTSVTPRRCSSRGCRWCSTGLGARAYAQESVPLAAPPTMVGTSPAPTCR